MDVSLDQVLYNRLPNFHVVQCLELLLSFENFGDPGVQQKFAIHDHVHRVEIFPVLEQSPVQANDERSVVLPLRFDGGHGQSVADLHSAQARLPNFRARNDQLVILVPKLRVVLVLAPQMLRDQYAEVARFLVGFPVACQFESVKAC